jgi:hypothetical protein
VEGGAFCLLSGVAGVAPACALAGVFAKASAQASSGTVYGALLASCSFYDSKRARLGLVPERIAVVARP